MFSVTHSKFGPDFNESQMDQLFELLVSTGLLFLSCLGSDTPNFGRDSYEYGPDPGRYDSRWRLLVVGFASSQRQSMLKACRFTRQRLYILEARFARGASLSLDY